GKEDALSPRLLKHVEPPEPEAWPTNLAAVVWEIHPPAAVDAFQKRVTSGQLSGEERKKALVALAFIPTQESTDAVRNLSENSTEELMALSQYWLQFRKTNDWRAFLKDWKSPDTQLPEAHPEMLALRQDVANDQLDMKQRIAAASGLVSSKAGKLHLLHLAASNALSDTIANQVRD